MVDAIIKSEKPEEPPPPPPRSIGQELLQINFARLIGGLGQGIANAQLRLDMVSMQIAQMMSGRKYNLLVMNEDVMNEDGFFKLDEKTGKPMTMEMDAVRVTFGPKDYSLLELGFTPTFYQFVDTIIEVKVSLSISQEDTREGGWRHTGFEGELKGNLFTGYDLNFNASTVSASYASKYQYSAEGSGLVRTKLVPVPPPAILEERIRRLIATTPPDNPVPSITGLSPDSAPAGGPAFTLTVNGDKFVTGSVVRWNGSDRNATFVSPTRLTAQIRASDIKAADSASVTVFNPAPGGGSSNARTFTPDNPVPSITDLSSNSATAEGPAFTLTVNGDNFVTGSVVRWKGSDRTTTFVSATQLTAQIPASDIKAAGSASVTVFNPAPGGGSSSAQTFTINKK